MNRTRPTLRRWRVLSGCDPVSTSCSRARTSRGSRASRKPHAQEQEQHPDHDQAGDRLAREDLPHLVAEEGEQAEDHHQRHRSREQQQRRAQLAAQPDEDPADDRRAGRSRRRRRPSRAAPGSASAVTQALVVWPPKISGSSAGTRTNAASSVLPTRRGREKNGRPPTRLAIPIPPSRIASPPASAARFGEQRPLELDGADQLGDEDEPEQRHGPVEDVGRGLEVLVEQRQPRLVEAGQVVGDVPGRCLLITRTALHRRDFTPRAGHLLHPSSRRGGPGPAAPASPYPRAGEDRTDQQ